MIQNKLHTIAFVYLLADGDEKNKCLLTTDSIVLIRRGKAYTFEIGQVKSIHFSSKLFLFPLIFGGAIGPFFFIAILNSSFHPVISLIGFLVSLFAFYIGISGKKSFVIETVNDRKEVFLYQISDNLQEFARFADNIIKGASSEDSLTFYLKIDKGRKETLKNEGELKLEEKGEILYTKNEKGQMMEEGALFLPVNYNIPTIQIKFEKSIKNRLRPKAYGTLMADNALISPHLY